MIHHSYVFVKYLLKKVNKAVKCGEAVTKKLPNRTGLGVLVVPVVCYRQNSPKGYIFFKAL